MMNKKERIKELCDYLWVDIEYDDANDKMIGFYLRCKDADMHVADADRYAILNTLFQYDIGMENASKLNTWTYEHGLEIYEYKTDISKGVLEYACEQLGIKLDFSNYRAEEFEEYSYY